MPVNTLTASRCKFPDMTMPPLQQRAKFARERAGFAGPQDAANAIGCSRTLVISWEEGPAKSFGSYLVAAAKAYKVRSSWLATGEGEDGYPWSDEQDFPSGIFTKERRADDDVLALQIGLESLLTAVLQRTPGAAAAFLQDVGQVAKGHRFSTKAGFLGALVDIANEVHSAEEAEAQARRLAGSAGRTRRGKLDQAR